MVAAIDWTIVLVALIGAVPATVSAILVGRVHRQIKTPSRTSIGEQVENVLHTSLANHYRIRRIGGAVGADASPESEAEAEQVPNLPEGNDG